jgi:hypothetical protein
MAVAPPVVDVRAACAGLRDSTVIDGLGGSGDRDSGRGNPRCAERLEPVRRSGLGCTHIKAGLMDNEPPLQAPADLAVSRSGVPGLPDTAQRQAAGGLPLQRRNAARKFATSA